MLKPYAMHSSVLGTCPSLQLSLHPDLLICSHLLGEFVMGRNIYQVLH